MATYTTPLKTLIEQPSQHRDDLTFKQRLELGRTVLFKDMEYEFFNDLYRRDFEMKFIRFFYNKEIGFETEGQFKFQLETWLQINMPYFNQLFESQLIKYDPLKNIDMRNIQDTKGETSEDRKTDNTEGRTGSSTSETTAKDTTQTTTNTTAKDTTDTTSNTTGQSNTTAEFEHNTNSQTDSDGTSKTTSKTDTDTDARRIHSDTPDKRLQIVDDNGVIQYASEITENSDITTANTTSDTTTSDTTNTTTQATGTDTTQSTSSEGTETLSETNSTGLSDTNSETNSNSKTTGSTKDDMIASLIGELKGQRLENMQAQRFGKDGTITYQQMVKELRQNFLRIERDIFEEMTELFMLIY